MSFLKSFYNDKKQQVVLFSSTAIALYGYDQGMMSLINTNYDYLKTMGIGKESPLVGVITSVYYLGCTAGAVLFSSLADRFGRKKSIFLCLAISSLGNLIMFVAGLGNLPGALPIILIGRIVMGLGVGGVDSVIPVYTAELSSDESRGKALAQEFQMNIFGLNMAFGINLGVTIALGKYNQWAWRIPIIVMQVYPVILLAFIERLPESPRWFVSHDRKDDALESLVDIFGEDEGKSKHEELLEAHKKEKDNQVSYLNMLTPGNIQFHPTIITIMGQVNQALTGYGAVSVYGPQIFQLLGYDVRRSEYLTQANYISYFVLMTVAWILIDALGRRTLMVGGSGVLTVCFLLLAIFGAFVMEPGLISSGENVFAILGDISLFVATGAFGIGWLATVWLIPTELFPTTARAQASAISVIVWGLANFAITFLSPLMFNNLKYWIFLIFAGTNLFAGLWTYLYLPESGGRSFEENQQFFALAKEEGTWRVSKVENGQFKRLPYGGDFETAERTPLLQRVEDQVN